MTSAWTTSEQVAARLGCSGTFLRRMMAETPGHIARPWVVMGDGRGRRTRYSWELARVDQWWRELHLWRASTSDETATAFGGATQTEALGRGSARPVAPPSTSGARSKKPPLLVDVGSLLPPSRYRASRA